MNEMKLEDFLPSYPQYERHPNSLFNVYEDDMYDVIQRKKEFSDLVIGDEIPLPGSYLKHQLFVQRFLSIHTPYTSLLIWHEVGVGKTITAIAVAESMKMYNKNRALVLVKGGNVARNFRNEIIKIEKTYIPARAIRENGSYNNIMVTASVNKSYEINTFYKFSKDIKEDLENVRRRELLKQKYSNRVIIIDEVHNLRLKDEDEEEEKGIDKYDIIYKFLHVVENCKILLLSATPMKDQSNEFVSIMNLILPTTKKLKEDEFDSYFNKDNIITKEGRDIILTKTKGYISYLRQQKGVNMPSIKNIGEEIHQGYVKLVKLEMKEEQTSDYILSDSIDNLLEDEKNKKSTGIYKETTQSVLCSYAKAYTTKENSRRHGITNASHETIVNDMLSTYQNFDSLSDEEKKIEVVNIINKYSIKYGYLVQHLLKTIIIHKENKDIGLPKAFVYCRYIEGSGLFLLESILNKLGYKAVDTKDIIDNNGKCMKSKNLRYAIITSKSKNDKASLSASSINNILDAYNHKNNNKGEYIQILLGSGTISESRSLKCVRDIFIMTPFWNYTETEQAIGRGIRAFSHDDLPLEERTVNVHRLMAIINNKDKPKPIVTIDELMYQTSYEKDKKIKQIEHIAREIAVDCRFFKKQNSNILAEDNSRECFYTKCELKCYGNDQKIVEDRVLKDTYNLFYTERDYDQIKKCIQSYIYINDNVCRLSFTSDEIIYVIKERYKNGFPDHVIVRSLSEIINKKERFIDNNGFYAYLKEKNNLYFLSFSLLHTNENDIHYTSLGQIYPDKNHNTFLNELELQRLSTESDQKWEFNSITTNTFLFMNTLVKDVGDVNYNKNMKILDNLVLSIISDVSDSIYDQFIMNIIENYRDYSHSINKSIINILEQHNIIVTKENYILFTSHDKRDKRNNRDKRVFNKLTREWIINYTDVEEVQDSDIILLAEYYIDDKHHSIAFLKDNKEKELKLFNLKQRASNVNTIRDLRISGDQGPGTVCKSCDPDILSGYIDYLKTFGIEINQELKKDEICKQIKDSLISYDLTPKLKEFATNRGIKGPINKYNLIMTKLIYDKIKDYIKRTYP